MPAPTTIATATALAMHAPLTLDTARTPFQAPVSLSDLTQTPPENLKTLISQKTLALALNRNLISPEDVQKIERALEHTQDTTQPKPLFMTITTQTLTGLKQAAAQNKDMPVWNACNASTPQFPTDSTTPHDIGLYCLPDHISLTRRPTHPARKTTTEPVVISETTYFISSRQNRNMLIHIPTLSPSKTPQSENHWILLSAPVKKQAP